MVQIGQLFITTPTQTVPLNDNYLLTTSAQILKLKSALIISQNWVTDLSSQRWCLANWLCQNGEMFSPRNSRSCRELWKNDLNMFTGTNRLFWVTQPEGATTTLLSCLTILEELSFKSWLLLSKVDPMKNSI